MIDYVQQDHFFFLFLLGLTSATFAQIDTSRYTYIQYRLNRLDNPDSSYALAGFWEQFDAMRVYGDRQLNIVHFGGSHIQADIYPNVLRNTFHTLDSGRTGARGFCFRIRQFIPIIPGTIRPAIRNLGRAPKCRI